MNNLKTPLKDLQQKSLIINAKNAFDFEFQKILITPERDEAKFCWKKMTSTL